MNSNIFNDSYGPSEQSAPSFDPQPLVEPSEPGPLFDELADRIEKTRYQTQEGLKSLALRTEKLIQRLLSAEDRMKQSTVETHERLNFLAARIKEGTHSDTKVEALIERHNQIVQSFELRLSQAQRVIENQSLQLAKQQQLIDDARRQIEKLKKL